MKWWEGRLVGFDLETTHPEPEQARIVTSAVALCGGGLATDAAAVLYDPGVPIPDEAAAIHGVTTEKAQEEGVPLADGLPALIETLTLLADDKPLVIFNAPYDLTVLDREARRLGLVALQDRVTLFVIDPLVCDKFLDRYRASYPHKGKTPEQWEAEGVPSGRTLEGMCRVRGALLEGAHDATFDAVAACRLAYRIGQKGQVVHGRRTRREADAALWERVRNDLDALQEAQAGWYWDQKLGPDGLAEFWRAKIAKGEEVPGDPDALNGEWPFIPFEEGALIG